MKLNFTLKIVATIICSTFLVMGKDDVKLFEEFPDHFSSEKELKENVFAKEWWSHTVAGKQFFISRVLPLQADSSRERITCWFNDLHQGRVVNVWDVRLSEVGPVQVTIDKNTSMLTITTTANTQFKGKRLASVLLPSLGP